MLSSPYAPASLCVCVHAYSSGARLRVCLSLSVWTDSRTKAAAETLVLAANGSVTERGLKLKTVSIRPAAIYGDGEERHLPRIIRVINRCNNVSRYTFSLMIFLVFATLVLLLWCLFSFPERLNHRLFLPIDLYFVVASCPSRDLQR